jgi:hypothetical protein
VVTISFALFIRLYCLTQTIPMGRQRRKVRRKHIRDTKKNRCGLHLAHLPLPFGTCIDLNTFTRILLYTSNQNLDDE